MTLNHVVLCVHKKGFDHRSIIYILQLSIKNDLEMTMVLVMGHKLRVKMFLWILKA